MCAWFCLWGLHMLTGRLAVRIIDHNHRRQQGALHKVKDVESYGACGTLKGQPGKAPGALHVSYPAQHHSAAEIAPAIPPGIGPPDMNRPPPRIVEGSAREEEVPKPVSS
mmetsp:Transcript_52196/g.97672  ORF Transcript_52196/g.97672 Transcript_52196/m.97672 type:complete len:110 (-) Transcript_52196:30-359(-)